MQEVSTEIKEARIGTWRQQWMEMLVKTCSLLDELTELNCHKSSYGHCLST